MKKTNPLVEFEIQPSCFGGYACFGVVAVDKDGEEAGCCEVEVRGEPGAASTLVEFDSLSVRPDFRRRHIARKLMRMAVQYADQQYPGALCRICAHPEDDSVPFEALIAFYRQFGFRCRRIDRATNSAHMWRRCPR